MKRRAVSILGKHCKRKIYSCLGQKITGEAYNRAPKNMEETMGREFL
jgi:hypothetical protein